MRWNLKGSSSGGSTGSGRFGAKFGRAHRRIEPIDLQEEAEVQVQVHRVGSHYDVVGRSLTTGGGPGACPLRVSFFCSFLFLVFGARWGF